MRVGHQERETATGFVNVDWPGATGVGPGGCIVAPKAANLEKRPSRDAPTFSMEATQLGGGGGPPVGPLQATAPGYVEVTAQEQTVLETYRLLGKKYEPEIPYGSEDCV